MRQKIQDRGIDCAIHKVYQDESEQKPEEAEEKEAEDEALDLEEIMADLKTPLNLESNDH